MPLVHWRLTDTVLTALPAPLTAPHGVASDDQIRLWLVAGHQVTWS
jgi:hypothetical protein